MAVRGAALGVALALGGCAIPAPPMATLDLPSMAVCTMPDAPAHVSEALDVAIDAWAQAGVPIRRGTPRSGCDAWIVDDAIDTCEPTSWGCVYHDLGPYVHVHYDIPTQRDPYVQVLTHELGHLLGAGHVDDPTSIMYYALRPAGAYASDPARGGPVDDRAVNAVVMSRP